MPDTSSMPRTSIVYLQVESDWFTKMAKDEPDNFQKLFKSLNALMQELNSECCLLCASSSMFPTLFDVAGGEARDSGEKSLTQYQKLSESSREILERELHLLALGCNNISLYTHYDCIYVLERLIYQSLDDPEFSAEEIANSSYDIPKVLDFLLRVSFPSIPIIRFDSDSFFDIQTTPNALFAVNIETIVRRNVQIWQKIDHSKSDHFVYSSKYNDAKKEPTGTDWQKTFSTRCNPALNMKKMLEGMTEVTKTQYDDKDYAAFKTNVDATEEKWKKEPNASTHWDDMWEAGCDDNKMNHFYDALDAGKHVKRGVSANVFENAVVSGAGLVLSPSYCMSHAPFLAMGAGKQQRIDWSDIWGDPINGKISHNVMWIDDQIMSDFINTKREKERKGEKGSLLEITDVKGYEGIHIPKGRGPPGKPIWYTLHVYMPTLFSGFIFQSLFKEASTDAKNLIARFKKLMPEDSIGEYYCKQLTEENVTESMSKARRVKRFQQTLNMNWAKMFLPENQHIQEALTQQFISRMFNRTSKNKNFYPIGVYPKDCDSYECTVMYNSFRRFLLKHAPSSGENKSCGISSFDALIAAKDNEDSPLFEVRPVWLKADYEYLKGEWTETEKPTIDTNGSKQLAAKLSAQRDKCHTPELRALAINVMKDFIRKLGEDDPAMVAGGSTTIEMTSNAFADKTRGCAAAAVCANNMFTDMKCLVISDFDGTLCKKLKKTENKDFSRNTKLNSFKVSAAKDDIITYLEYGGVLVVNTGNDVAVNLPRFLAAFDTSKIDLLKRCLFVSNGGVVCYKFGLNDSKIELRQVEGWDEYLKRGDERFDKATMMRPFYFDDERDGNHSNWPQQIFIYNPYDAALDVSVDTDDFKTRVATLNASGAPCADVKDNYIEMKGQDIAVRDVISKLNGILETGGRVPTEFHELYDILAQCAVGRPVVEPYKVTTVDSAATPMHHRSAASAYGAYELERASATPVASPFGISKTSAPTGARMNLPMDGYKGYEEMVGHRLDPLTTASPAARAEKRSLAKQLLSRY